MDLPKAFAYDYEQGFYSRNTGGKTRYVWIQPKIQSKNVVILFSHGMGFDAVYPHLLFFQKALDKGYQIFSYDMDGHGCDSTTILDAATVHTCVEDALSFLTARTCDSIHLAGMSLGGRATLDTITQSTHPQVQGVSLLAAPLKPPSYLQAASYESLTIFSRSFHRQWKLYGLRTIPTFGPFGRQLFPVRSHQNYVLETLSYLSQSNWRQCVHKCQIPTLLKYGTFDGIAPLHHGKELLQLIPQASLEIVQATHLSFPAKATLC